MGDAEDAVLGREVQAGPWWSVRSTQDSSPRPSCSGHGATIQAVVSDKAWAGVGVWCVGQWYCPCRPDVDRQGVNRQQ